MLTIVKRVFFVRQFSETKCFYIRVRLDFKNISWQQDEIWRLVMYGISGYMGYPNQFQVTANPVGAGLAELNKSFAKDFGLNIPPVYDLPLNVNMGFGGGMYGGMYGMGMMNPYMMSSQYLKYLNMDYKDRLAYDLELRNLARENMYNEGKIAKNYASATDGLTGSIAEACSALQSVIIEGQTDQIVAQFDNIVDMIRRSPLYERLKEEFKNDPVALEKTLRNCAREQFQAATGQDLRAMIQQNCDSSIANGFWNAISFGNSQTYSAEEVIARIEGVDPSKSTQAKKVVGKIGGVTAAAATGAAIGLIGGPVGAAIGGGIGAIAGIIGSLC